MSSTSASLRLYRSALKSCGYEPLPRRLLAGTSGPRWRAAVTSSLTNASRRDFSTNPPYLAKDSSTSSKSPSSKITDRSRVLARPERYTPPSHPPRQRKSPKLHYYGGELSSEAKQAQDKKEYPHMMPPDSSWRHWFLTSKVLHVGITLTVLTTLAVTVFCLEFRRKTPYAELLPSWSEFFRHPINGSHQVWSVYVMDSLYHTEQVQAKREKDLEDARKRKAYRVAHGLENPAYGLQGHAAGLESIEFGEKDLRDPKVTEEVEFERKLRQAYLESISKTGGDPKLAERYIDKQSSRRDAKKWLGIWG